MTSDEKNLLMLNAFFLIVSDKTNDAYLDKSFNCYLFQTKSAADAFVGSSKQKISVREAKHYLLRDFWSMYGRGAKGVCVFLRGENKPQNITLSKEDAQDAVAQYYNNETNGYLNRLQQTSEKKYLSALASGIFFTPVNIRARKEKEYPYLHYSYATFKDDVQYFLLFSTLQEYESWRSYQETNWEPMEVTIKKFGRIRGKNPVLINPLSNKLILTHKLLKQATAPSSGAPAFGGINGI